MELLKQLYAIHAPSGKEKRIRSFIEGYISQNMDTAHVSVDKTGNLFITKGSVETYPCIVAHLDQVQHYHSKDFRAIETRDIIFGYSPSKRRQEGLGADDKNGIWIALKCLQKYDAIKIAFFVGEEVGCVGSNAADLTFFEDCRFVIQPDRRGVSDLITQISWENLCSEEFLSDIQPECFGYKPTEGLMTDIEILRENGLSLSCINLSCGYYEPHTDHEFTVKADLENCLSFVRHIIENCTKTYVHQSEPHKKRYDFSAFYFPEDMIYDIMVAQPDYTAEEAWEVYSMNFPRFSKEEFVNLYEECRIAYGMDTPAPKIGKRKQAKKHKRAIKKQVDNTQSISHNLYF